MKKYIFIILILILFAGLFLYISKGSENRTKMNPKTYTKIPDKDISTNKTAQSDIQKLSTSTQTSQIHTTENSKEKNIHKMSMYETISIDEAVLTTKVRKYIKPVTAIRVNHTLMKNLTPKDVLLFSDIDGVDYDIHITHVTKNSDGSISTTGTYEDEGITYTTTITQSENVSFATLSTPQGTYEIETSNAVGYVYKANTIRKQIQKTKGTDVIILPIPKAPPAH